MIRSVTFDNVIGLGKLFQSVVTLDKKLFLKYVVDVDGGM